jgi:hypothetical protein
VGKLLWKMGEFRRYWNKELRTWEIEFGFSPAVKDVPYLWQAADHIEFEKLNWKF